VRLLIDRCAILDPDTPTGYRSDQHVVVEGNTIIAVGDSFRNGPFDRVLPGQNRLAVPGLINAHTHSPENFMRGLTDRLPLEPWLVYMFGMCGEYSPRDHYVNAMLGAIEMIHTGVTGVVDHLWMSPGPNVGAMDAAMQAYRDSGMRAVVAPLYRDAQFDVEFAIERGHPLVDTFYAKVGQNLLPLQRLLELVTDFVSRWHGSEGGRLRAHVGPAGLQWCTEELLRQSLELARRHSTCFHMHLLETHVQDWVCRKRFGKSGVEWLAERDLLGPDVSLSHSVHVTPKDVELIAESGASVVHNPASNLKLGSGLAPVRVMLDNGVPVALGTDGAFSNDNQVLFEVLRLAALVHTTTDPYPNRWISAREAWAMATEAGAVVMGNQPIGRIREGYLADIALLDLSSPHLVPLNDAYRQLAFCESGASVRTVIIDGNVVMSEGHIEVFDEESIIAEAQEAVASRLYRQPTVPAEIQVAVNRFLAFQQDIVTDASSRSLQ
jgi:5-methylthioadenosine/S-adenosylhomocysteine deaminase